MYGRLERLTLLRNTSKRFQNWLMRWRSLPPPSTGGASRRLKGTNVAEIQYFNAESIESSNFLTNICRLYLRQTHYIYEYLLVCIVILCTISSGALGSDAPANIQQLFDIGESELTLLPENSTILNLDDESKTELSPLNDTLLDQISISNQEILRETGYGHHRKRLGQRHATELEQQQHHHDRWPIADFVASTTLTPPLSLADIAVVSPIAEVVFYANESLTHVRTDAWLLPFSTCLEARFRLEGKRTRLLMYTCQMTEGGECKLDKFTAIHAVGELGRPSHNQHTVSNGGAFGDLNTERCVSLRPWIFYRTPFAFHFKFVRRPRRFSDPLVEERHRRRRRLGKRATREVGRVTIKGFKKCELACKHDSENDRWSDDGSIPESQFSVAKYDYSKRRKRRRLRVKND